MRWLHVVVDVPSDLAGVSTRFWSAVLGWPAGRPWPGEPAFQSFEPPEGSGSSYVHRQIGEHGPRVHVDLEVAEIEPEAERLRQLGAAVGRRRESWQVMTSPGGLPFCLVGEGEHPVPAAVDWGGHRGRLVQVCIDSPGPVHDAEVAFWRDATGGRWVSDDDDEVEFAGKLYPDGGPVQLLLQRLGDDSDATLTTAHIDLGTDDLEAETRRVAGLGATRIAPGHGWNVLRDPVGMVFCVTANPPG